MNPCANHRRLARLQRECDMSVAPVFLLSAACAVLVLVLGLNTLLDETTPSTQAGEPTQQTTPPAT